MGVKIQPTLGIDFCDVNVTSVNSRDTLRFYQVILVLLITVQFPSYTLGSSEQKAEIDEEPLTLESRASLEESVGRVR